ncbi:hypothetical protein N9B73_12040 [Verrucomicrobiales bacterium]|jgi:hypothetical protein|nr:hypothetical protein [Verrucomicrobiales bacterium]
MKTTLFPLIFCLLGLLFVMPGFSEETEPPVPELKTKVYLVPATFISSIGHLLRDEVAPDPFADSTSEVLPRKTKSVQEMLEQHGPSFGEGASASFDQAESKLTVTNSPEQLQLVEAILESFRNSSETVVNIYLEYIEVEHVDFSDWLFENAIESDGTELRNEVQKWIKDGRAEIIESALVAARSGQRAKVESIDEYIYPTEYNPARIPNEVTLKGGAEAPIAATSPTAFETRNLGTTFEVDPVLGSDNHTIDLSLAPEIVKLEGIEQWHKKTTDPRFLTHFPTFYTMKISTQVTSQNGRYAFLGTTRPLEATNPKCRDPLVLQFVRADLASLADWSEVMEGE